MRFFGLFLVIAALIISCDNARVYEFNQDFTDRTWKSADSTRFDFVIKDTKLRYSIYCNVRNSLDYPWSRLFVQYTLRDSTGRLDQKLLSDYLFEPKSGKPTGSSGLGDLYDHQFPILKNHEFKHPGKYSIRLDQFMRTDTLKGVSAVGIRVEKMM